MQSEGGKPRALIADDHPIIRAALRDDLVEGGFEVCAETATGGEALAAAMRERPDICLLDMHMPGDGVRFVREIRARLPAVRLVLLTAAADTQTALEAARAGAHGYAAKGEGRERLLEMLRTVVAGGVSYPWQLLLDALRSPSGGEPAPSG